MDQLTEKMHRGLGISDYGSEIFMCPVHSTLKVKSARGERPFQGISMLVPWGRNSSGRNSASGRFAMGDGEEKSDMKILANKITKRIDMKPHPFVANQEG